MTNGLVNVVIILDGGLVQEVEVFDSPQNAFSFFKEKTGFDSPEQCSEAETIQSPVLGQIPNTFEGSRIEVRDVYRPEPRGGYPATYIGPEERPYLSLNESMTSDEVRGNTDAEVCGDEGPADYEEPVEEISEPKFYQACPDYGAKGLMDIVQVNGRQQQKCSNCGSGYWLD